MEKHIRVAPKYIEFVQDCVRALKKADTLSTGQGEIVEYISQKLQRFITDEIDAVAIPLGSYSEMNTSNAIDFVVIKGVKSDLCICVESSVTFTENAQRIINGLRNNDGIVIVAELIAKEMKFPTRINSFDSSETIVGTDIIGAEVLIELTALILGNEANIRELEDTLDSIIAEYNKNTEPNGLIKAILSHMKESGEKEKAIQKLIETANRFKATEKYMELIYKKIADSKFMRSKELYLEYVNNRSKLWCV